MEVERKTRGFAADSGDDRSAPGRGPNKARRNVASVATTSCLSFSYSANSLISVKMSAASASCAGAICTGIACVIGIHTLSVRHHVTPAPLRRPGRDQAMMRHAKDLHADDERPRDRAALALTVYVIWWLVNTVEGWLRPRTDRVAARAARTLLAWPRADYRILLLLAVGSLVNAYAGKIFLKYWDDFLGRIPLVKTLYGGFRDVVSLLPSGSGEKRDLQRVVLAVSPTYMPRFRHREDVPWR